MQQPVRTSCLGEEAVVVLLVGADGAARMDLALIHEALLRAHQELIETRGTASRAWMQPPVPAHQTPGAAGHQGTWEGFTTERWRTWTVDGSRWQRPEAAALLEDGNPACTAWPLHGATETEQR